MTPLLAALGIEGWTQPGWLLLAPALAVAAVAIGARSRPDALAWGAAAELRSALPRHRDGARALALLLRAGAVLALCAVLAGPLGVHRTPPEPGRGLDLVLALDASGSMSALDTTVGSEQRTRLDLAREVVARFASRRASEGDRVALVVFGESVFTQSPLSSDADLLAAALARIRPGMAGETTALGDALALAVKRAHGAHRKATPDAAATTDRTQGRVVVLLTDGRHNAGALSLEAATRLAAASGVRVHAVAIGTAGRDVAIASRGASVRSLAYERHDVDTEALTGLALATGGRFFAAQRSADLAAVYAEIDALERVERPLPARLRYSERPEPLLALAGALLLLEIAIARVLRRRLP